ncbi:virulence factor SrfC family protein [Spirosoma fluviale]|uniref:Virulence factor n=1 Tax=Spirosoma fluviale TaxID=1597977 RepID=A0A286GW43_9BACT|nr:virulence factor SrfC family protein [Spirosoma fluviale]SOD99712.1 Putative virulence factor [Spirosoma fluviale]
MFGNLTSESQQLQKSIQNGLNWLNQYAEPEKRISTLDELGKLRRQAKRLQYAAGFRPALAMFGISQVGKSYLVSNLARIPGQSLLQIDNAGLPADRVREIIGHDGPISFIDDINPKGGGTEATGVVTRFTTHHQSGQPGYLVRLLSQIDVVKIMALGYQYNVINSSYPDKLTAEKLDKLIASLNDLRQAGEQPGMSEDDVLDLRDYLNRNFQGMDLIGTLRRYGYWEKIASLIPQLRPVDRWSAFSLLWHEDAFMTDLFRQISQGLSELNFAAEGYVGLEAIAPQHQTIVDVKRFDELGDPERDTGSVNVMINGKSHLLNRSILTTITAELVLPLPKGIEQHSTRRFLQYADILDFPGARSMEGSEEVVYQKATETNAKMAPFLRGKVFYLFNSYNDSFGISSLLFCMDDRQNDVKGKLNINSMISQWVGANVGRTAEEREIRENALNQLIPADVRGDVARVNPFFLILTKINVEIDKCDPGKIGQPHFHDDIWEKRLETFFDKEIDKGSLDKWSRKWNNQGAFKNTFMIRDPRYSQVAYQVVDGIEEHSTRFEPVFADLQQSFVQSRHAVNHFHNPLLAWQEATQPSHNGIDYLLKYLLPACHPAIKEEQLRGALQEVRQGIGRALCAHYEGGSVEEKLKRARERRERIKLPLGLVVQQKRLGQLLATLTLAEQHTGGGMWDRQLAIDAMSQPDMFMKEANGTTTATTEQANQQSVVDFLEDMLGDFKETPSVATKAKLAPNLAYRYAEIFLGHWVGQLKDTADDRAFLHGFGFQKEEADILMEEMVRSMERDTLKDRLADKVGLYIEQPDNLEIVLSIGRAAVNEFVNTLGWSRVSAEDKRSNKALFQPIPNAPAVPIFDDTVLTVPDKTSLQPTVEDPGRFWYSQWFRGYYQSFEYNVLREANLADPERARINGLLEVIIKGLDYQC